jgi:pantoate--beta-alanine ligase
MILFKKIADLQKHLATRHLPTQKIGFVPTMGALHKGHISLITLARQQNECCVCSIFVNPTQFNDPADFEKYPVTIEKDMAMLEEAGCDILFLPSVQEMYPNDIDKKNRYDLGYLETILDGKYRPGHFQGVCMVVHRLLDIVKPDNLYLGQKDYQQCMVISKLTELIGIDKQTTVNIAPTLREEDGLAMSSRNMRLTEQERKQAIAIFQTLSYIKKNLQPGSLLLLKQEAADQLSAKGFKTDYIEIATADNLNLVDYWDGKQKLVALAAAFLNDVRLIDNLLLN